MTSTCKRPCNVPSSLAIQGVLRDELDVERLGDNFKERYSAKKADPFDEDGWEAPEQRLVGSKFVLT